MALDEYLVNGEHYIARARSALSSGNRLKAVQLLERSVLSFTEANMRLPEDDWRGLVRIAQVTYAQLELVGELGFDPSKYDARIHAASRAVVDTPDASVYDKVAIALLQVEYAFHEYKENQGVAPDVVKRGVADLGIIIGCGTPAQHQQFLSLARRFAEAIRR